MAFGCKFSIQRADRPPAASLGGPHETTPQLVFAECATGGSNPGLRTGIADAAPAVLRCYGVIGRTPIRHGDDRGGHGNVVRTDRGSPAKEAVVREFSANQH